jgi:hypothetical protein
MLQVEAGITVVFSKKAVLTRCRNGNAISRECLGDEGGEPPGPAITDGDGEAMMANWLWTVGWLVVVIVVVCCCCCCAV